MNKYEQLIFYSDNFNERGNKCMTNLQNDIQDNLVSVGNVDNITVTVSGNSYKVVIDEVNTRTEDNSIRTEYRAFVYDESKYSKGADNYIFASDPYDSKESAINDIIKMLNEHVIGV